MRQLAGSEVNQLGRREGYKCLTFGLVVAYIFMTWLYSEDGWIKGVQWPSKFNRNGSLLVAVATCYASVYLLCADTARAIHHNRDAGWRGVICAFLVLWSGTITGSVFNMCREAFGTSLQENLIDFVWKPWFWITLIGFIPTTVIGIWFGHTIKDRLLQSAATHARKISRCSGNDYKKEHT